MTRPAPAADYAALMTQAKQLTEQVQANVAQLQAVRAQLLAAVDDIDAKLREMRALLGERPAPPQRERGNRVRNARKMEDYVYDALKQAGRNGLSKLAIARAVREAGFVSPTDDLTEFAKSVYVSGIHKHLKRGHAEHFRLPGESEGRYRLTPAGLAAHRKTAHRK